MCLRCLLCPLIPALSYCVLQLFAGQTRCLRKKTFQIKPCALVTDTSNVRGCYMLFVRRLTSDTDSVSEKAALSTLFGQVNS